MGYKKKSRKMKGGVMPPKKLPIVGEDDNVSETPFEDLDISSIERISDPDLSDIDFGELNLDESTSSNMSDISAIEPDNSSMNEISLNEDVMFEDNSSSLTRPENETTLNDSSGGRTRRRKMKKQKRVTIKKRKGTRKYRNSSSKYKIRRTRKYKKGGANIGCNTNDPNFSIYNTKMLQMFPYKP